METYWLASCTPGITSPSCKTLADVAIWMENNVDPDKVRIVTVKKYQIDRKKLVKDTEKELVKAQERLNVIAEKLERIKKN